MHLYRRVNLLIHTNLTRRSISFLRWEYVSYLLKFENSFSFSLDVIPKIYVIEKIIHNFTTKLLLTRTYISQALCCVCVYIYTHNTKESSYIYTHTQHKGVLLNHPLNHLHIYMYLYIYHLYIYM